MGVTAAKPGLQPLPAPPMPVPPLAVKERSDLLPARMPASGPARAGLANPRAIDFGPRAGTVPFPIQRHARVSAPSDAAELEAEDIGRRVAHMPLPALRPIAGGVAGTVQRRAVAPVAVSPAAVRAVEASRGGGAPLPAPVRQYMEPRFGADFGGVRLHTGPAAAQLATGLQANAFTYGRDIWFGAGQYRPDTSDGRALIAHELTHTIQQGGVIQRSASAAPVVERSEAIHRSIWDDIKSGASSLVNALGDPLAFIADKANMIPGFRMLTIVLGVNPITMAPVAASPGNVLMALIEFIPGGGLVTQALQASGVFDKVGGWIADKVKGLVQAASAIKSAVTGFIASLSAKDIVDPGGVWDRAKRIFTEPVEKLIAFCKGVITDILKFIKDAVLLPVAKLAQGTDNWPLLVAVLGENPVTGEKVAPQPEVLIGGFMKLIGQDEIWQNMVAAKAVPRAWAWFQGAMAAVKGFVTAIPGRFKDLFGALTIEDLVTIVGAFKKVAGVFGGFVAGFLKWGLDAAIDLLKIVFDVVSPGAFDYVMKTGAALKGILKNPLPFVKNLIAAGKLGLSNFLGNFVEHLKAGLIDWLLGAVPGVYIPKALNLAELGQFAISILGLSWAQIRGKIVKALGPKGEAIMKGLELAFDVVKLLVTGGIPAVWNFIKEKLTNLKDMAIDAVVGFVKSAIIEKAIPKLLAMFVPGAGFISAIVSIWDTIKVFVEKLSTIAAVVKSYVDGIVAIAAGEIGGAAKKVEMGFRQMLTLAISFFAGFVGLGGIPAKVKGAVESLRGAVDHGLDVAITWLVGKAKALFASLFGGGKDKDGKSKTGGEIGDNPAFSAGDGTHHLWVDPRGGSPVVMLASTPKPLTAYLAEFRDDARDADDDDLVKTINKAGVIAARIESDAAKAAVLPIDTPARATLDSAIKTNEAAVRPLLASILDALGKKVPEQITKPIAVKFTIKPGLDPAEYTRQLGQQEAAINAMVVADWMTNRSRFADRGRDPEDKKTRSDYRAAQRALVVERLQQPKDYTGSPITDDFLLAAIAKQFADASKPVQMKGYAASTAEALADNWMRLLAALHSPDQVAGGENKISGLGLADVNSDIGNNWGGFGGKPKLADRLESDTQSALRQMKVRHAFWRQIRMNVRLSP